jgi:hypothetical protein
MCGTCGGEKGPGRFAVAGNAGGEGRQALVLQFVVQFVQQVYLDDFTVAPLGA